MRRKIAVVLAVGLMFSICTECAIAGKKEQVTKSVTEPAKASARAAQDQALSYNKALSTATNIAGVQNFFSKKFQRDYDFDGAPEVGSGLLSQLRGNLLKDGKASGAAKISADRHVDVCLTGKDETDKPATVTFKMIREEGSWRIDGYRGRNGRELSQVPHFMGTPNQP